MFGGSSVLSDYMSLYYGMLLIVADLILVGLNHFFDHLTAYRTGLTRGQMAIVAFLQVDTDLPWCICTIKRFMLWETPALVHLKVHQ